jgi:DDE superfamily endonuclease
VVYKRGRRHVHSPDPAYAAKLATVAYVRARAEAEPERVVTLYLDELTYYRRPTVAAGYALAGQDAPWAEQGWGRNTSRRIAACLDPRTGQLVAWQRSQFDRRTLLRFYRQAVVPAYPMAQRIYVLQDNWPVHFHADVLAGLADSPIRLVRLPTYAPWTNPVEKVWRKLYAEVLHLHRFVDAWEELTQTVQAWLDQWAGPSPELLRYVGLLCPN